MRNCGRTITITICLLLILSQTRSAACDSSSKSLFTKYSAPTLLEYEELKALSSPTELKPSLAAKVKQLLNTPFLSNEAYYSGHRPKTPHQKMLGPVLRALLWNINRGTRLDQILPALKSPARFISTLQQGQADRSLLEELELLQGVDLLILTEVDMGVPRTGYRNVVRELAEALGMNYAYGVEFIEIAPTQLEQAALATDRERYLGLHGSAILSRYPIRSAALYPLTNQPFDWFEGNLKTSEDNLDQMRRLFGDLFFVQKPGPMQLRRGGRMLLLANLDFPALPEQTVTVAVTHLESSASPKGRRSQMREVLSYLQPIKNPVILGGDLNTSGVDRARGEKEDTKAAPPPIEAPYSELPNPEKEMLWDVACLRFADNRAFDFRGDRENSANGSNLLLANSNETTQNGFAPTFELQRTLGNFGKFKLDWIFVKGYLQTPLDKNGSYRFAPHFGRVFRALNYSSKERISDHSPLIVDLPLVEPREKN